jgi:hypothetical protein
MGTGILPAGPDTYMVTERRAPVLGGSTAAQQAGMTEANAYCAQQGKQFLPVDTANLASISNPSKVRAFTGKNAEAQAKEWAPRSECQRIAPPMHRRLEACMAEGAEAQSWRQT